MVVKVKVAVEPSLTDADSEDNTYVGVTVVVTAVFDVSLITVDADEPPIETVNVSVPSVRLSAAIGIEIVASPFEPTVTVPVSSPFTTSAVLMPDKVYVIRVPEVTFVVVNVNEAVEPSL